MDEAIRWMPDTPHAHLPLAVGTAQGVSPAALLIALAVGQGGNDLDRPLDDAPNLGQGFLNQALQRGQGFGRLHPIIAYPLEAFGKRMLHQTPNKRVDVHRFPLNLFALVGPIMLGHPVSIVAINASERDRRTHHIFGEVGRQALVA
jgi:hypothetical protein